MQPQVDLREMLHAHGQPLMVYCSGCWKAMHIFALRAKDCRFHCECLSLVP